MLKNRAFSAIRCRRIGHLFAMKFHQNICVDSSTSTNWDVYESGQMLCWFVDIDESGCLRIGTNVVSIRRHRRIGMSTNLAICESICYRMRRHSVPRLLLRNHSSNNDSSYSSRCCILDMVKLTMHAPARTSLLDSGVNRPTWHVIKEQASSTLR